MINLLRSNWWRLDLEIILRWVFLAVLCIGLAGIATVYIYSVSKDVTITIREILPLFVLAIAPLAIFLLHIPMKYVFLAAVVFDIPFAYDIYFGWNPDFGSQGTIAGFNISITTIAIAGLYAIWFTEALLKPKDKSIARFHLPAAGIPLLIYVSIATLSIVNASEAWFTVYEVNLLLQMFLLFIYIATNIRTREDVIALLTIMLIIFSIEGLYLFWQRFGPTRQFYFLYNDPTSVYTYRVTGHFGSPNVAGAYFSFGTVISLVVILMPLKLKYKLLGAFSFAISAFALFLTLSRGGWLAAAIGIVVILIFLIKRGWLSIQIPALIAVAILVISLLFPDLILKRIFGSDGGAAEGRNPLNEIAVDIASDHLFLGIGANNFAYVMPEYIRAEFSQTWLYTVHNKYLLVWSETGTFGLMAFVAFLIVSVVQGWRVWLVSHRFYSTLGIALLGAICGHAFHLSVDIFNDRPMVQMLWLVSGLIMALFAMTREKSKLDTSS